VTESEIASLLELQPHLPLAYFFRYLNCTASRNFTGAMEALHRYFDYALQFKSSRMRAQKHEKKEKDGAEKEGEEEEDDDDEKKEEKDENENAFCLQYASLNLAILHFRFGQIEEAYTAVQETLRVAQQHVDHRCIARALFWLFHIASAMDGKRALPLLRRCKSQATELGLHSLERLAALNIAEAAVSSGTDSSSFVWSVLQSEDMSKNERKKKKKKSLAESKTGTQKSQHTQQDISIAQSRSLLLRSAVWEVYGNRSLCRESLIEHMFLSGKCDAEAMCSAYCRLALLDDNSRVSSSSSSSSSSHIRSLRMILRTRELFPHAPSVPGLGWPRALCLALFRRSLLRNEWKIAEMASLQLSALSLPPTATIASILSIANEDGVSNEFRSMLSSSDSGGGTCNLTLCVCVCVSLQLQCPNPNNKQTTTTNIGTSCALFAESCFCAVKLMAARKQWERALRTARVLFKVCKSFGLEIQASSVQCEIGKIILKSSEPATALWPLLRALAMCRRLDHRLESAICEMTMAELHLRLGHTHKAENLMKRNLSVLLQQGDSRIQGIALLRVAEIRIRSSSSNEKQSASRYLSRALSAFVHAEDVTNVQYVLYLQARLYNDMNLFQDRDSASSKWSAVSSYRTRAESRCPDQYRFLNTTEALEKEIGNGNPLVALVS